MSSQILTYECLTASSLHTDQNTLDSGNTTVIHVSTPNVNASIK